MLKAKTGFLPLLPLALLALACSGGGSTPKPAQTRPVDKPKDKPKDPEGSGKVTLSLVNDSAATELRAATLKLAGMDIREPGKDWVALPLTAPEVDLIHSTGQPVRALVEAAAVPAGVYTAFRIRFAPDHNHVRLRAGDQVRDLKVPSAIVDDDVYLNVEAGTTVQAAYCFNTAYAVQEKPAGSGAYTLRAPKDGRFRERANTGAITGKVTWGADGSPMAGVAVTAQRVIKQKFHGGELLSPEALRTVVSREDGTFELDLLGTGHEFRVVALPGGGPHPHKVQLLAGPLKPGAAPCQLALEPAHAHPGRIAVIGFPGERPDLPEAARRKVELITRLKDAAGHDLGVVHVAGRSLDKGDLCVFEGVEPGTHVVQFSYHSGSKTPLELPNINRPGGFNHKSESRTVSVQATVKAGETVQVPKAKGAGMSTGIAETDEGAE